MAGSSTEIGSAAVILTASADLLVKGLDAAVATVGGAGARMSAAFTATANSKGLFGSLGKTLGDQLGGLGKNAFGGIGASISNTLGTIAGGVAGGPLGIVAAGATLVGESISEADKRLAGFNKIVRDSSALGIGASQFQGLSKVLGKAGIDADHAGGVLAHMGKQIADASQGHGRAFPALVALGIDAKALMSLPLDEQFKAIATSISKLPPGAQQASAALHIFGESGAGLLPQLQRGGQGIQEFIEQQKSVGAVLSDSQLHAAATAASAWKAAKLSISATWEGMTNRLAIAVAPVLEFGGKALSKFMDLAAPVFDWLGRLYSAEGEVIGAVFATAAEWIGDAVGAVKEFIASFGGVKIELPTVRDVVIAGFRVIGTTIALAWDTLKAGAGILATVAGSFIENGASIVTVFRTLVDLLEKLPNDVKPDWLAGFIQGVDKADDRFKKFGATVKEWGMRQTDDFGNSAKRFNEFVDRLQAPKKNKPGAIGPAEIATLAGAIIPAEPYKLAGAIDAASKEAYSITVRARAGFDAPKNVAAEQLAEEKKQTEKLEQMRLQMERLTDVWSAL